MTYNYNCNDKEENFKIFREKNNRNNAHKEVRIKMIAESFPEIIQAR